MNDKQITDAIVEALQILHTGREWVCFPELRLGTGYGGKWEQRIDLFALSCYPSRGLQSIAYEVKASRSDYLREVKEPEKRRAAMELSNLFYFATPPGLLQSEELPPDCGLVEYRAGRLRTVCKATYRDRHSPEWRFVASLCRRILQAPEMPGYLDLAPVDLDGLTVPERDFLVRTMADARATQAGTGMTKERAAAVLDRVARRLRGG